MCFFFKANNYENASNRNDFFFSYFDNQFAAVID